MNSVLYHLRWLMIGVGIFSYGLSVAGCSRETAQPDAFAADAVTSLAEGEESVELLGLPELKAAELGDKPLSVVATTSIIGDVVAQVGGDAIALTTLLGPGQDPHSYVPAARDLTAVAGANVIFVNGWDLEEGLASDLESIADGAPIVPISANIKPLPFGDGEHDHQIDPHVWFDVHNARQWVINVEQILSALDPANSSIYKSNAAAYQVELEELEEYAA